MLHTTTCLVHTFMCILLSRNNYTFGEHILVVTLDYSNVRLTVLLISIPTRCSRGHDRIDVTRAIGDTLTK